MNNNKLIEVVLVNIQPFRFDWSKVELLSGRERWLIYSNKVFQIFDKNILRNFTKSYLLDDFSFKQICNIIHQETEANTKFLFSTNDEYSLILCDKLKKSFKPKDHFFKTVILVIT